MTNTPEVVPAVLPKDRRPVLPLLVALFIFSYSLLTLLVIEQGKTIENQRSLIQQLFGDSMELTSMKGKLVRQRQAEEALRGGHSQAQKPVPPASKMSGNETEVAPQAKAQTTGEAEKARSAAKPPRIDDYDIRDVRRVTRSI